MSFHQLMVFSDSLHYFSAEFQGQKVKKAAFVARNSKLQNGNVSKDEFFSKHIG